jgi:hypothetical protein
MLVYMTFIRSTEDILDPVGMWTAKPRLQAATPIGQDVFPPSGTDAAHYRPLSLESQGTCSKGTCQCVTTVVPYIKLAESNGTDVPRVLQFSLLQVTIHLRIGDYFFQRNFASFTFVRRFHIYSSSPFWLETNFLKNTHFNPSKLDTCFWFLRGYTHARTELDRGYKTPVIPRLGFYFEFSTLRHGCTYYGGLLQ